MFLACGLGSLALADAPMEIELVCEVKAVQPGRPFYVALSLKHGRGHHSYWKTPGIVGVPTNINWTSLPRGVTAGEIEWPAPERVDMFEYQAQGYKRDVLLPILITPSKSLRAGTNITLQGRAGWMSCSKQCNPGFKGLSITLPVSAEGEPHYDAKWQGLIQTERARVALNSGAWTLTVEPIGETGYVAVLTPGEGARAITERDLRKLIWFTDDGQVDTDQPQKIEWQDGKVVFHLKRPEYLPGGFKKSLAGILVREGGWNADGSVPVMRVAAKW